MELGRRRGALVQIRYARQSEILGSIKRFKGSARKLTRIFSSSSASAFLLLLRTHVIEIAGQPYPGDQEKGELRLLLKDEVLESTKQPFERILNETRERSCVDSRTRETTLFDLRILFPF
ncbi:hypothetical protein TNCV_2466921 [Trichonephila clavipes]|nr:hypothetical protein TNCV_2466921 [Trichonephila clavipes]